MPTKSPAKKRTPGRSPARSPKRQPPARSRSPKADGRQPQQPQLVSRIGPLELDWPRSLGFFGGIGLAVGAGLIEPPLGLFIASVPFLKMVDLPGLPNPARFVSQMFEGVAKPVGGDTEGTVRLVSAKGSSDEPVGQSG